MIISGASASYVPFLRKLVIALTGLLIALALWMCWQQWRAHAPIAQQYDFVFCDAEQRQGALFVNGGHQFNHGELQSNEVSFSGSHSCKIKTGDGLQFGFGYELAQAQPGDMFRATVWKHRPDGGRDGFLVASAEGEGQFYRSTNMPAETRGEWEKLQLSFSIPYQKEARGAKVYVYTEGNMTTFFDDLKIEKIGNLKDSLHTLPANIKLLLNSEAMDQLKAKRAQALRAGILESEDTDWVAGWLGSGEKQLKVKLRLKGDWLDHLQDDKWSFRVKTRANDSWNRMRYFSLHTPKARSYLHEWVLHKFFEREDVLTTRYDFVSLELNKKLLGIYAYEEHFDKVLVEHQKRREGPIVKFSEDGFWAGVKRQLEKINGLDHDIQQPVKMMETAPIEPFKEGKLLASPELASQYETAQNLMYQYRNGLKAAEEIFDIDKLARYYAICDVTGAYHGIAWHNQRFYFNPLTQRLEPIGFDGFGAHTKKRTFLMGQGAFNHRRVNDEQIDNKLFLDRAFTEKYISYVYQYSSRAYIEDFLASIQEALRERELLLQSEFEKYQFNISDFIHNAQRAQLLVLPYGNQSLRAYTQQRTGFRKKVKVANMHSLPVELIGYGRTADVMSDTLAIPLLLEAFTPRLTKGRIEQKLKPGVVLDTFTGAMAWKAWREQEVVSYQDLSLESSTEYIFYQTLGIDSVFSSRIAYWPMPTDNVPIQELFSHVKLLPQPYYRLSEGMVFFPAGKHLIQKPIILPAGLRVIFEAGAQLDFIKGAFFLSRSPVFMHGSEAEPVKIYSSDQSARAFTVLEAKQESELRYAVFEELNTMSYKSWQLTGAVTFYESDVTIDHCVFRKNHCEDALNIIRSKFSFNNSLISDTFADGLDADFCKAYIDHSTFQYTGNDGLDISGSNLLINHSLARHCGDKGLSVGEESDATVFKMTIQNCPIAVASKDLSVLVIEHIEMEDCQQGFTAYQKKPEYGGATIVVQNYKAKNVKRLHNIRKDCVLQLKGKVIEEM